MATKTATVETLEAVQMTREQVGRMSRSDYTKGLKRALKTRSGKDWSVTGGSGTAYGWIDIKAPKSRSSDDWGSLTPADQSELCGLLGLRYVEGVYRQGVSIASSWDHYFEYWQRAHGLPVEKRAEAYWD